MSVAELVDIAEAIGAAVEVDFGALSSDERIEAVESIHRLSARLAGLEAEVVGAYDAHGDWTRDRQRSAAVAMRHRCRLRGADAHASVRLARRLRRMPLTAAALAAGTITRAHAARLARAESRPEFTDAEATLIDHATRLSFADFDRAVTYWEDIVEEARRGADPEPPDPRETNRAAHVSTTLAGMVRVDAWLDPIGGAAFSEAAARIERELFDTDWHHARAIHGDATTTEHLWRTPAQRRADALVELAHRATTAPASGKRPLPLVIIHTDQGTFEAALADLLDAPRPAPTGQPRLCETDDGTVIRPSQMIEQAVLGHCRRLVYQSPGVILDYGRKVRLFTGELRQAIRARDRTCDHDGCDIPARHCEIDHHTEWQHGGTTTHHNARTKCSFHHRRHKHPHHPHPHHKKRGP